MIDAALLAGAALTGLIGTPHCALMCGGIATGFSAGSGTRLHMLAALQPNLGRVTGYAIAGAIAGGTGHLIVAAFDSDALRLGTRLLAGLALLVLAARLAGRQSPRWFDLPARALVAPLSSLRRRLPHPAGGVGRFLAGLAWGWLPCGLSASLLTVAWLRVDALDGALTMLAFGFGGLPVMTSLTWTGHRLGQRLMRAGLRPVAVSLLALLGLTTLVTPWLSFEDHVHPLLSALGCGPSLRR